MKYNNITAFKKYKENTSLVEHIYILLYIYIILNKFQ